MLVLMEAATTGSIRSTSARLALSGWCNPSTSTTARVSHLSQTRVCLPTADMAVQRVAERVRQGGHNIPAATIRRRFDSGLRLLTQVYQPLVNEWAIYDNSGDQPVLVDWSNKP